MVRAKTVARILPSWVHSWNKRLSGTPNPQCALTQSPATAQMKAKKNTKGVARGSLRRRVKRLLDFPEPPPQMDVNDPRWPDAFAQWAQRKAEWLGTEDPFELFGRALGVKKSTVDGYVERRRAERRAKQKRLEDMGKSSNDIYG